jgi:hypothetical protein
LLKPDGSFEVDGIAPGTWQVRVQQGISPRMTLGVANAEVDDHDLENVALTVHAPQRLKGVVRVDGAEDQALPAGLSLWLDSDVLAGSIAAMPHQDGSFDFENVPWGRHRVLLRGDASGRYYIKQLRYGTTESPDAAFSLSANRDALEVLLSAGGARVSGVVTRNGAAGSATPQIVLLPDTPDTGLRRYDTHLGRLDQFGAFAVKEPVRPGEYMLYAFEGVPDGAWTEAEFIKEMEGRGVRIKVAEGEVKTVELPLIPRSEIAALLSRLGMDW